MNSKQIEEAIQFFECIEKDDNSELNILLDIARIYLKSIKKMPKKKWSNDGNCNKCELSGGLSPAPCDECLENRAYNQAIEACTLSHLKILKEKDEEIERLKQENQQLKDRLGKDGQ